MEALEMSVGKEDVLQEILQ